MNEMRDDGEEFSLKRAARLLAIEFLEATTNVMVGVRPSPFAIARTLYFNVAKET